MQGPGHVAQYPDEALAGACRFNKSLLHLLRHRAPGGQTFGNVQSPAVDVFSEPRTSGAQVLEDLLLGIRRGNALEGYWSQLKRSIRGTHVHVSGKHLWKCVSEFSSRYNMRKTPGAMFDQLIASLWLPRLADG